MRIGPPWALVFAAGLPGQGQQPPTDSQVNAALERMVERLKSGDLNGLIPFDREGMAVRMG